MTTIGKVQSTREGFTPLEHDQYAKRRFEHKCKSAFELQKQLSPLQRDSGVRRNIDRSLKIAASIKGWQVVREHLEQIHTISNKPAESSRWSLANLFRDRTQEEQNVRENTDAYVGLLCTVLFLERLQELGMTQKQYQSHLDRKFTATLLNAIRQEVED